MKNKNKNGDLCQKTFANDLTARKTNHLLYYKTR